MEYVRARRIHLQHGSRLKVQGTAQGEETYAFSIRLEGALLHMVCGCEAFRQYGPCKHLWGAVVESERAGYLSEAIYATRLRVVEDDEPVILPAEKVRPSWKNYLRDIDSRSGAPPAPPPAAEADDEEIYYLLDPQDGQKRRGVVLHLQSRSRPARGGAWSRLQPLRPDPARPSATPEDREILTTLGGARSLAPAYGPPAPEAPLASFELSVPLAARLLPRLCATGRCVVRNPTGEERSLANPLRWDPAPFRFRLLWQLAADGSWQISAEFVREDEMLALDATTQILGESFLLRPGAIGPLEAPQALPWIDFFRDLGQISIPGREIDDFLREAMRRLPEDVLHLPLALRYQTVDGSPAPTLRLRQANRKPGDQDPFTGKPEFVYEAGVSVPFDQGMTLLFHPTERRIIRRDREMERAAVRMLEEAGFKPVQYVETGQSWDIAPGKLLPGLRKLYQAGWYVELQGLPVRSTGRFNAVVSTGIDWFELTGDLEFDEMKIPLPELLKALGQGESMFRMSDGSLAILGEDQLHRLRSLLQIAEIEKGHVRFKRNQVALLDALLAAQPEIRADETLEHAREELRQFRGIEAAPQPDGFSGALRDYQREGLAWLLFLQRFRFGGCLADDMGVGKTAQVLALLETRRARRAAGEAIPPSLVVAPRSLIFNWQREAARFTPALRTVDFTGAERSFAAFEEADVVLTTYGTLRRDIAELQKMQFDYAILDEAQAIKNFGSASSKAVRLLRADHRLAMTGTPVENHLGELWSLFEFLNPGMLGHASVLKLSGAGSRTVAPETRELLAAGLRPFLLRRTKEQVAKELPAKVEQTLMCELEPAERKLYDELRDHYRSALLSGNARTWSKRKLQVLEALLRLRQAACHPGLLDKARAKESSTKLDTLLSQLGEVLEEGHKALIFSQFTSLLALLRQQLDAQGTPYEYLDGKTKDRQTPVERFQSDPECKLFLISLKAGGTGLNLTAADYVFLLDPWWNPAVEAQAIDRTHRIGQDKPVFAYRLIAKDTVEERVLELQNSKRELATAILSEDNALVANLQPEDLELLLS